MELKSSSFADGERMAERYAFGKHDPENHFALSDNVNPQLSWSGAPEGTKSFALICHDDKVPSSGEDVNQEGKTVPASLPRVDFFHWVLVDIAAGTSEIAEGSFCDGVTAKGKAGPDGPNGTRQGLNNYTQWFEGDADMGGQYHGYDGPAPPWNDEIIHDYHFTLYALDVEKCAVDGSFTGEDARKAIEGHVLAEARITGHYAINPDAK